MNNRFLEMDVMLKNRGHHPGGVGIARSMSGPVLQDITHAGPYRIAYDRLTTLGVIEPLPNRNTRKFHGTSALQGALNSWTPYLDKVLQPPAYILTGGLTVNKPGEHGKGNAIDVDGFWWSDTNEFLANNAPSDWCMYLRIEASLRKVFGTVLNYDYNASHHDHWHCDIGMSTAWRKVESQAKFAQRALNVFWGENLTVDGAWGNLSKAACNRHGYDFTGTAADWNRFLDDVMAKPCSSSLSASNNTPASQGLWIAHSFSNPKVSTNLVTQRGIDLIKSFEGFRSAMYNDPAGHCTIGYGHLIHKGNCNGDASENPFKKGVAEAQAAGLMMNKLNEFQEGVNKNVKVELNSNQFDALVSFTYNVGMGNFLSSTLLKELNKGNYIAVPTELKKWTKGRVNGQLVDLPGLVNRRDAESSLFAASSVSEVQSIYAHYSKPFYDTGEHALAGEGDSSFPLPSFRLINVNGVSFTYGQIITMADLFENPDVMRNEDGTVLKKMKELVLRNENFYRKKLFPSFQTNDSSDSINWNEAKPENKRDFSRLAADNYEHFSPLPAAYARFPKSGRNHKEAWENYHKKAIWHERSAQKNRKQGMSYLAPDNTSLLYNAFGDHYLTDAFAAGHQFNKDYVIRLFQTLFTNNGVATAEANKFMENLAKRTFTGDVRDAFSKLEAVNVNGHPLINTTERYAALLKKSLEPSKIETAGNLAVKIIHDKLGRYGLDVTNKDIKTGWKIYGDGFLDLRTLGEMRKAVAQSIRNLTEPAEVQIASAANPTISNFDFGPAFKKVWDYVPVPTQASQDLIKRLIKIYTDPASELLLDAAENVINHNFKTMIAELKSTKELRPGNYSIFVDGIWPHVPFIGG